MSAENTPGPGPDGRDHDESDGDEFVICSEDACVVAATITCRHCQRPFEAICVHCHSGIVFDEPLTEFTVCNIDRVTPALAQQLRAWPQFRPLDAGSEEGEETEFANHCPACGTPHEDTRLHDEPDDPFFDVPHARPGSLRFTPLSGTIQLSGDEHYDIE